MLRNFLSNVSSDISKSVLTYWENSSLKSTGY